MLSVLKNVFSSHVGVGPSVAILEHCVMISDVVPEHGIVESAFLRAGQPHTISSGVEERERRDGVLATRAALMDEKSCFWRTVMSGLHTVLLVS